METSKEFEAAVKEAAHFFSSLSSSVRIISHIDCDGVSASAILALWACMPFQKKYSLVRLRELDESAIEKIRTCAEETIFFVDIGSAKRPAIEKALPLKKVFIFDHHYRLPQSKVKTVRELNPKQFGVDERRTISSSGIAFLFVKELGFGKSAASLALIGAMGDAQEDQGFIGYNHQILKEALTHNQMEIKKTLRLFGRQTRPVAKAVELSTDIPMKGVTNNPLEVSLLLRSLGIPEKRDNKPCTIANLSQKEEDLLNEALQKRMTEEVKKKAWWLSYTLLERPEGSPTRDLREFSTLLNACGRTGDIELGIRLCLGDQDAIVLAQGTLTNYKSQLGAAKNWVDSHPEYVLKKHGLIIIKGENNIHPDIAGTISSIFARSGSLPADTIVCTLAREGGKTKISLRITTPKRDVCKILEIVMNKIGGQCGGHSNAAGGIISEEKEDKFILELQRLNEKNSTSSLKELS